MRVLVADDDPTSLAVIQGLLKKQDCDTVAASNGIEALSILTSSNAPQIAILDWMMPGMDGIDVCRRIHELAINKPPYIIILTSKDGKADMAEALDSGADDYIIKPCDPIELRARLNVGKRSIALRRKIEKQNLDLQNLIEDKQHLLNELKEDLSIAGSVQKQLFPKGVPEDTGLDIAAKSIPCSAMGGDMYDIQKLTANKTAVLMLDVAGHGVASALIAAFAKASFTKIIADKTSPGEILESLNEEILKVTPSALYLTAFLLVFDKSTSRITYSGAGHIPQMHYSSSEGDVVQVRSKGMPIGMMASQKYVDSELLFNSEDSLVLFTDGFTETFNSKEEMFGKHGMQNAVFELNGVNSTAIVNGILEINRQFRGSVINDDDLCILAMKKV